MALTDDDLKKIDEIADKHTEELAGLVSKSVERLEGDVSEVKENISEIKENIAEVKETQKEHSAILAGHSDDLGQIKGQLNSVQKLADYHDREVERLLKYTKLKPLALEE